MTTTAEECRKLPWHSTEYCGGGLIRRTVFFPDGSQLAIGYCHNSPFVGPFCTPDTSGVHSHFPRPPGGWLVEVFLRGGHEAAVQAQQTVCEWIRSHCPRLSRESNRRDAEYRARHPHYVPRVLTEEALFASAWNEALAV